MRRAFQRSPRLAFLAFADTRRGTGILALVALAHSFAAAQAKNGPE